MTLISKKILCPEMGFLIRFVEAVAGEEDLKQTL